MTASPEGSFAPLADAVALVCRYASWMSSRRLDEVAGLAFERDRSSRHHEHPIGDRQRLVDVLLDEQDRRAVVGRGAHRTQQTVDDERSKAERQFVDQQESALAGEAPGEREHLLLAARQQPDAAVEVRFELREQLPRHGRRRTG